MQFKPFTECFNNLHIPQTFQVELCIGGFESPNITSKLGRAPVMKIRYGMTYPGSQLKTVKI